MRVRIFAVCSPKNARALHDAEDIIIDIEMPFTPFPGLLIKPTPQSDYLKIAEVFWTIEIADRCEAHSDQEEVLRPLSEMTAQGWRLA